VLVGAKQSATLKNRFIDEHCAVKAHAVEATKVKTSLPGGVLSWDSTSCVASIPLRRAADFVSKGVISIGQMRGCGGEFITSSSKHEARLVRPLAANQSDFVPEGFGSVKNASGRNNHEMGDVLQGFLTLPCLP